MIGAVVPARNEAARIAKTVAALRDRVDEVIVVDDGSHDDTAARARDAGARVLRLARNRGKGAAVSAGVSAAKADILLFVDADVAETAGAITALLQPIVGGDADLAIAAPPRDGASGFGLVERFARWGIERATTRAFDRPLSGQRAVRRSKLPPKLAHGFGLEVAMTIDAIRSGARVIEVPLAFQHAKTGRDLGGFAHRARQGLDIARALASRVRG